MDINHDAPRSTGMILCCGCAAVFHFNRGEPAAAIHPATHQRELHVTEPTLMPPQPPVPYPSNRTVSEMNSEITSTAELTKPGQQGKALEKHKEARQCKKEQMAKDKCEIFRRRRKRNTRQSTSSYQNPQNLPR